MHVRLHLARSVDVTHGHELWHARTHVDVTHLRLLPALPLGGRQGFLRELQQEHFKERNMQHERPDAFTNDTEGEACDLFTLTLRPWCQTPKMLRKPRLRTGAHLTVGRHRGLPVVLVHELLAGLIGVLDIGVYRLDVGDQSAKNPRALLQDVLRVERRQ